jgi:hypothetical protein
MSAMQVQVAAGATNQELRIVGTQGTTTIKTIIITSDKSITVSYNGTAPVLMAAGGFHALTGTALTTVMVTNATLDTANLTLWLAGLGDLPPPLGVGTFILTGIAATLTAGYGTCMAVSSGLVACWDMNETTGTRLDHVGGFDFTMVGSVPGVAGQIGNAAQFDGTIGTNYLTRASYTFPLGPSAFTLAFWVKLTTIDATNRVIMGQGHTTGSTDYQWVVVELANTGQIEAAFDASLAGVIFSSVNLVVNVWKFVVIWHDGVNLRLQQNNGTIDVVAAHFNDVGPSSTGGISNLNIGAVGAGLQPLKGLVDSTQIWNRVLTAGERTTLWNGGAGV